MRLPSPLNHIYIYIYEYIHVYLISMLDWSCCVFREAHGWWGLGGGEAGPTVWQKIQMGLDLDRAGVIHVVVD